MNKSEMYSAMLALADKRAGEWDTEVVVSFPRLSSLNETVTLGSFAWVLQSSKKRLVKRSFARLIGDVVVTPAELARDYLSIKYPKPLRCNGVQARDYENKRSHPLYAQRGHYPDAVYLDIQAAYWTILQVIGWNVEYSTGRFLGKGDSLDDFPFADDKLTRNCLVSAGLNTPRRMWHPKTANITSSNRGNRHKNIGLWCCVQDILNGIAADAVRAGAVYVHTDGYIVQQHLAYNVIDAISKWGLNVRVMAEGSAHVYGAGAYQIAGRGGKRKIIAEQNWRAIRVPDNHAWLRDKFRFWKDRTDVRYE